jgi:hypothetical protein
MNRIKALANEILGIGEVKFTPPHYNMKLDHYVSHGTYVYTKENEAKVACSTRNDCHGVTMEWAYRLKMRTPLVRRVRISLPWTNCLHIGELEVYGYNNDKNLALGKNATQSSTLRSSNGLDYGAHKAVDGNIKTFSYTNCTGGKFYISACKFLKYHVFFILY